MGAGSYLGGHSRIFVSDSGTRWEVSWDVPDRDNNTIRPRWDAHIGVETGRKMGKEIRSFLSMCAVAFRNDQLSDRNPRPPAILIREIKRAGGNKRWIVEDRSRLAIFESFFLKRSKSL
jgi:hypothetical protein